MNKEQQELLDDAYNRYRATIIKEFYEDTKELRKWATVEGPGGHTKEEFIDKCKTDTEFSETWGLKIEERELTWDESNEYYNNHQSLKVPYLGLKVPTRLITITYNEKTIESYKQ
jgi:hypothetical protein